ncbi:MAG: ABC transporter ATP-binding protein [Phycisphaerae bacterium]
MDDPTRTAGNEPLLAVADLRVVFPGRSGLLGRRPALTAVDGVSFRLEKGESLGLVGESGCGKSTIGRAVLGLLPPNAIMSGSVRFDGRDIAGLPARALRPWRRRAQIIFQDPGGSLNPRMRVGSIIAEPLRVHRAGSPAEIAARAAMLMDRCGLPRTAADRYPHEFSGGQKQRIAIARAVALEPDLIICDEPTSAMDVSVQAQILNLLKELQAEKRLSYLFISHDIAVVHHFCDRVAVMQAGKVVESGPRSEVLGSPRHEYSRTLISAAPGMHRHMSAGAAAAGRASGG